MLDFDFSRSHVRGLVFPKTSRAYGDMQSYIKSIKKNGSRQEFIISCSFLCVSRVMDARRKFGEHERSVRVVRASATLV